MIVPLPPLTKDRERAEREFEEIRFLVEKPDGANAGAIANWVWAASDADRVASLYLAMSALIYFLAPAGLKFGRCSEALALALVHTVCALTVARLRLAMSKKKPLRWAVRVLRLLPATFPDIFMPTRKSCYFCRRCSQA